MNLIKDAYRHLQDPLLREQHDLILRSAPPQAPMSAMMPYSATHQHQQQQTSFSSPSQPSPRQQRTPYELLGLNPSATLQDILNAFQYYSAMNLSAEDRALLNQAFTTLLESRYEHPSIQSPPVQQQAPPIFSLNMSINFGSSGFQFR
jgi:DnaJ-class molecular chaperone